MSREMTLKYAKHDECKALMTFTLKFGPHVPITYQTKQLQDIKENMQAHSRAHFSLVNSCYLVMYTKF